MSEFWVYTKHSSGSPDNRNPMEIRDGLGLSPRKVTYLRYFFERGGVVKTSDLATRFGVDPSTITKTLSELSDAGLLTLAPYHGASLSPAGMIYAEFLVKRHRILALALTHYGLSDDEACAEVSRFESLVSRDAINRMCQAMGHPHQGGCGKITHDTGCLGHGAGAGLTVPLPVPKEGEYP